MRQVMDTVGATDWWYLDEDTEDYLVKAKLLGLSYTDAGAYQAYEIYTGESDIAVLFKHKAITHLTLDGEETNVWQVHLPRWRQFIEHIHTEHQP